MKKIILCVVIFTLTSYVFADSLFKDDSSTYNTAKTCKEIENSINAKEFNENLLKNIDELSFYGYSNLAYDICDKIKSLNIDEDFLKKVKIHQSVAHVRILVENGVIESIHQIPEETMGIFSIADTTKNTKIAEINSEELSRNHSQLMAQVATIALIEKKSFETEKIFNDYFVKYKTDYLMARILINYLLGNEEYNKALKFINETKNNVSSHPKYLICSKLETVIATIPITSNVINWHLLVIDDLLSDLSSDTFLKLNNHKNKMLIYKYEKETDDSKNETMVIDKEDESFDFDLQEVFSRGFSVDSLSSYLIGITLDSAEITLANKKEITFPY